MNSKDKFHTTDLPLTSYLVYLGYSVESVYDDPEYRRRKKVFVLSDTKEELKEHIDTYYSGKARVDPMKFFMAEKTVKVRMHQDKY